MNANINELMHQVREDMDVCDSRGEKLGTVGEVNIGSASDQRVAGALASEERSFFEVKTGLLGLGDRYWLPGDAIREVSEDRVILQHEAEEAKRRSWGTRPAQPESGAEQHSSLLSS